MSTRSNAISTRPRLRSTRRRSEYFVICLRNEGYEVSLEPRKFYVALPDHDAESHRQLRVVDESGEDYLYPADLFASVDVSPALRRRLRAAV